MQAPEKLLNIGAPKYETIVAKSGPQSLWKLVQLFSNQWPNDSTRCHES